ncbi:MAG: nucleotide exchange factor GrpE [Buchnera aphidicola (Eriosoma harunire)]
MIIKSTITHDNNIENNQKNTTNKTASYNSKSIHQPNITDNTKPINQHNVTNEQKPINQHNVTDEQKPINQHNVTNEQKPINQHNVTDEQKPINQHNVTDEQKPINQHNVTDEQKPINQHNVTDKQKPINQQKIINNSIVNNKNCINNTHQTISNLSKETHKIKQEITLIHKEIYNIKLNTQATIENLKKKSIHDIDHIKNNKIKIFITKLIPIIDKINVLVDNEALKNNTIHKGLILTSQCLMNNMHKYGLKSEGQNEQLFDPKLHTTKSIYDRKSKTPRYIKKIEKQGYILNNDIIRKATVTLKDE